jgi:hypothetical protein
VLREELFGFSSGRVSACRDGPEGGRGAEGREVEGGEEAGGEEGGEEDKGGHEGRGEEEEVEEERGDVQDLHLQGVEAGMVAPGAATCSVAGALFCFVNSCACYVFSLR